MHLLPCPLLIAPCNLGGRCRLQLRLQLALKYNDVHGLRSITGPEGLEGITGFDHGLAIVCHYNAKREIAIIMDGFTSTMCTLTRMWHLSGNNCSLKLID